MSDETPSTESSTVLLEQRFLEALSAATLPVSDLLEMISALRAAVPATKQEQYALVLEDKLAKAGELEGLIRFFELCLGWAGNDMAMVKKVTNHMPEALQEAAHKNRLHEAFIKNIGLEKASVSGKESLRRLHVLMQCTPGTHCLDKTWGFGTVVRLDAFYGRITIDFDRKKGHALAFGYAAETLRVLGPDHILSRFHADKAAFFERFKKDPAGVAKAALRSFGPMSVTRMEDEFVANGLLPDAESYLPKAAKADKAKRGSAEVWKHFWTHARTALKNDPEVSLPPSTKKNEPIRLLLKAVSFGDSTWFEEFSKKTDVSEILSGAADLLAAGTLPKLNEEEAAKAAEILTDRLEYAYIAARTRTHVASPAIATAQDTAVSNDFRYRRWQEGVRQGAADMARATLLARDLALPNFAVEGFVKEMATPKFLANACFNMSSKDLLALGGMIPVAEDEVLAGAFCASLPEMPFAVVEVMLPGLLSGVAAVQTRAYLTESFGTGEVSFPLLLWMVRHQNDEMVRTIVPPSTIAATSLLALSRQTSGEELRLFHQIAKCFEDFQWVVELMDRMDTDGRLALLNRIRSNDSAWEPPMKRKLVKDILAKYPDLTESHSVEEDAAAEKEPLLTSWRSYNMYVENFRRLVEEEIPKNAHDIDVARSYGDLRENFEYQTAKDTQRMLLQRQADLNEQIASVRGTDFAEVATDKVAMGTEVVLRFADGSEKTYSILGEWDNEESLQILPCRSRIAEAVLGQVVGAQVSLPPLEAGAAPQNASIVAIRPLSEAVRAWIRG